MPNPLCPPPSKRLTRTSIAMGSAKSASSSRTAGAASSMGVQRRGSVGMGSEGCIRPCRSRLRQDPGVLGRELESYLLAEGRGRSFLGSRADAEHGAGAELDAEHAIGSEVLLLDHAT